MSVQRWRTIAIACAALLLTTCARPPSLLDEVRMLGELRVVTRHGPHTYFLSGDEPDGPEYDLIAGFAERLGVRLKLMVAERAADVLPTVIHGQAHLAAAALTVSEESRQLVDFGPAYQQVTKHLVYRDGRRPPRSLKQLQGRQLEVASGSGYARTLQRVQARYPDLVWRENPHVTQTELLQRVADGSLDFTVVNSNAYAIYRSFIPNIRIAFDLAEGDSVAWAFARRRDHSLREEAEKYFDEIRANGTLERILNSHYGHVSRDNYVGTRQFVRDVRSRLPAWRSQFQLAGMRHDLDWRLLAAMGYQESGWDPEAVSATGVRGLMMLTEETARSLGIEDRNDPHESIHGGARYMAWIRDQLPDTLEASDRVWFALAAYNIGIGHLLDARRLTRQHGGDPNHWVDVRPYVKRLSQPGFYEHTRYGFARGGETVAFVDNVRRYYNVLTWMTRDSGEEVPGWMQQRGDALTAQIQRTDPPARNGQLTVGQRG